MSEPIAIEFTKRELYSLWAAAHHKDQPLLKRDLGSAYQKIEAALAVNGSVGPVLESPSAADTVGAGPTETPRRRGW